MDNGEVGKNFMGCADWLNLDPEEYSEKEYFYKINYQLMYKTFSCNLGYWKCDKYGLPFTPTAVPHYGNR